NNSQYIYDVAGDTGTTGQVLTVNSGGYPQWSSGGNTQATITGQTASSFVNLSAPTLGIYIVSLIVTLSTAAPSGGVLTLQAAWTDKNGNTNYTAITTWIVDGTAFME